MHGLLSGSLEQRAARVFSSTVGGLFYAYAMKLSNNVWAPAIAHTIYNAHQLYAGGSTIMSMV